MPAPRLAGVQLAVPAAGVHEKVYAPVPPFPVTQICPLVKPTQLGSVTVVSEEVKAGGSASVRMTVSSQPLLSKIAMVYVPAGILEKVEEFAVLAIVPGGGAGFHEKSV